MKVSLPTFVLVLTAAFGCGREREAIDATAGSTPAGNPAVVTGTFEIDGTSYPFRIFRCDLSGDAPDGILLLGGGDMPDGRRLGVEVERLAPEIAGAGTIFERASIGFGTFTDGDGWEARATSYDGERWVNDATQQVLGGPLIEISGDDLVIAGTYKHASKDLTAAGSVRATCTGTPPA